PHHAFRTGPMKTSPPASPPDASDIAASDDEGRRYREGVFRPLAESELPLAPDTAPFPAQGSGPPYRVWNELPRVHRLAHRAGPPPPRAARGSAPAAQSPSALGVGRGSADSPRCPNPATVNARGSWWLLGVGLVTQLVGRREIELGTVAPRESAFAGMGRLG